MAMPVSSRVKNSLIASITRAAAAFGAGAVAAEVAGGAAVAAAVDLLVQAARVALGDGVAARVRVEVDAAVVEDRVARRPAPGARLVVAQAEAHEAGRRVLEPAGEADRDLERAGLRRAVADAEAVVDERLDDGAIGVGDHARRAHLVGADVGALPAALEREQAVVGVVVKGGQLPAGAAAGDEERPVHVAVEELGALPVLDARHLTLRGVVLVRHGLPATVAASSSPRSA